jgi:hypothetical protein
MKVWSIICLSLILFLCNPTNTLAGQLAARLEQYPNWKSKPSLQAAKEDLIYPDWMEGTWQVTSTLEDLAAPLAPEIVTPGFEGNRKYLHKPVQFQVRFARKLTTNPTKSFVPSLIKGQLPVVADRAFNGLKIAKSYLGDKGVLSVKVDPKNPNRQITFLPQKRQLISTVIARGNETPNLNKFIATEVTQQVFRSAEQFYLNEVETTTAYELLNSGKIVANQVTAIYLSPQDPNYFQASDRPVALYRYHLALDFLQGNRD